MKIKIKGTTLQCEVADNFWKRLVGLSFSRKKNMLFVFSHEAKWSFWMFLVRYPIKFVFINKQKTVVDVKVGKPISLNANSWKVYKPRKTCKYVLETPSRLKVRVGDRVIKMY
jgi:uncharacterized membrane protein (UPF0127 family)